MSADEKYTLTDRQMKYLSVIIPVYNCEDYIRECLQSLTNQCFNGRDFEVLIIDDGSTDSTKDIAEEYCEKNPCFRAITQENQGVSAARNTGLCYARDRYVAFVDADDYVADDIYPKLVSVMEKNSFDFLLFNYTTDANMLDNYHGEYEECRADDFQSQTTIWRGIYKKAILDTENIRFLESIQFAEDFLFNYMYSTVMGNFARIPDVLYFHRKHSDSVSIRLVENGLSGNDTAVLATHYNSLLQAAEALKKWQLTKGLPIDNRYHFALTNMIVTLLWVSMRAKQDPRIVLDDLKKRGLSVNEINGKIDEGHTVRMRIKAFTERLFKLPFMYRAICFAYRIIFYR